MRKVMNVGELVGAVVVDNCGMIELSTGELVYWGKGVSPESMVEGRLMREFYDEQTNEYFFLPCVYM